MQQGKVKWFSFDKGFGFIEPASGGKDVFVHRNNIVGMDAELRDGDKVEFEVEETPKGLSAQNVRLIDA